MNELIEKIRWGLVNQGVGITPAGEFKHPGITVRLSNRDEGKKFVRQFGGSIHWVPSTNSLWWVLNDEPAKTLMNEIFDDIEDLLQSVYRRRIARWKTL